MNKKTSNSNASSITTKEQIIKSAITLGFRQVSMHLISITSNIVVANLLTPSDFGLYAIFLFISTLANMFSDLGLGLGLLREPTLPDKKDVNSVFTFATTMSIILFGMLWFLAPIIAQKYNLAETNIDHIRLLGIVPFFFSYQNINTVVFDKQLKFSFVAKIELLSHLAANLSLIMFAWHKQASLAFLSCIIVKPTLASIIYFLKNTNRPSFSSDFQRLKGRFKHGLLMQSSNLVSVVKDSIVPVFVGYYLGKDSVGLMNWAGIIAGYPILLIGSLNRLYLPVLSNISIDKYKSDKFVKTILNLNHWIVAPATIFLVFYGYHLTSFVYGDKWLPGLTLLRLFLLGNFFSATSVLCLPILNAHGKSYLTFLSTSAWAVMSWSFGIPLLLWLGINGFGIAHILIGISNIYLYYVSNKFVNINWFKEPIKFWLLAAALFAIPVALLHGQNKTELIVTSLFSCFIYVAVSIYFNMIDYREIKNWLKTKIN